MAVNREKWRLGQSREHKSHKKPLSQLRSVMACGHVGLTFQSTWFFNKRKEAGFWLENSPFVCVCWQVTKTNSVWGKTTLSFAFKRLGGNIWAGVWLPFWVGEDSYEAEVRPAPRLPPVKGRRLLCRQEEGSVSPWTGGGWLEFRPLGVSTREEGRGWGELCLTYPQCLGWVTWLMCSQEQPARAGSLGLALHADTQPQKSGHLPS